MVSNLSLSYVNSSIKQVWAVNDTFVAHVTKQSVQNLGVVTQVEQDGSALAIRVFEYLARAKPRTVLMEDGRAVIEYVFLIEHEDAPGPDPVFVEVFRFYLDHQGVIAADAGFTQPLSDIQAANVSYLICGKTILGALNSSLFQPRPY